VEDLRIGVRCTTGARRAEAASSCSRQAIPPGRNNAEKNILFPTAREHCRESQKGERRIEEHIKGEHKEEITEREAHQRLEEMTAGRLLAENCRDRDEEESKDGWSQR
jgi:hypothetical protein